LLSTPLARTVTALLVAPSGTGAVLLVALHDVGVAVTPPNFTHPAPCVAPKLDPAIVILAPTAPVE